MSRELFITDDFNSVRRCESEAEMLEVARILISAGPDCVTLDAASPDLVNYDSKIGLRVKGSRFDSLFDAGCEPFGFMVERLKEAGIRVLANVRMNDHHGKPEYWSPWEQEHVAWSLAEDTGARDWKSIGALRHMDYAIEGVRTYRLSILEEILTKFDVDGLQLDFGRTAPFVSDPKREKGRFMTGFLRSTRALLENSSHGGNDKTLGVLLPWDPEFCQQEGLEIQDWVREGLVDYISPGEWYYADWNLPLQSWADLVKDSKCRFLPFTPGNVSPYQDFENGEPSQLGTNPVLDGPKIRAIADNFAAQGSDGFAFYNFYTFDFGRDYPDLRTWVDPNLSAGRSRHYLNCRRLVYHATERDAYDLGLAFARDELHTVGDEVGRTFRFSSDPTSRSPLIRCAFDRLTPGDEIEVRVNDTILSPIRKVTDAPGQSQDSPPVTIWEGDLHRPPLIKGENSLNLRLIRTGSLRTGPVKVGEFEILVEGDS